MFFYSFNEASVEQKLDLKSLTAKQLLEVKYLSEEDKCTFCFLIEEGAMASTLFEQANNMDISLSMLLKIAEKLMLNKKVVVKSKKDFAATLSPGCRGTKNGKRWDDPNE